MERFMQPYSKKPISMEAVPQRTACDFSKMFENPGDELEITLLASGINNRHPSKQV
jgi:hypothetical protein